MKVLGSVVAQTADLGHGLIPLAALPSSGVSVNTLVNVNGVMYKCLALTAGVPSWKSLDVRPVVYTFTQSTATKTWTITHNLADTMVLLQCYNSSNQLLAYSTATSDAAGNVLTVVFSANQKGYARVVSLV